MIVGKAPWAANQPIKMISEGSCDTEDCSNDAENSALHHRNKLYFKPVLKYNNILQYYYFYCIFIQINAAFVSIRAFFLKH